MKDVCELFPLKKILKIDSHIFSTLLFRGWNIIAGGVLLLGIPRWFTAVEQGYYFTFASLIGLQVFFELGFNYVITQFVGHEAASLTTNMDGSLSGDQRNVDRLCCLVEKVRTIFKFLSMLFIALVGASGLIFLKINQKFDPPGWESGWVLLVIFAGINLYLSPLMAIMEGLGSVGQVARIRLIQSIIGYILLWFLLEFGAGLLAVPVVLFTSSICTILWLKYNAKPIMQLANRQYDNSNSISWIKEIFPFQWKIALSWISGYFIFQLFNPIIFSNQGAVEAGKIGISLSIFSTILSLSMSWITSKTPSFASYIAQNDRICLNALFKDMFYRSCVFNFAASLLFILAIAILKYFNFKVIDRLADIDTLCCLLVVCLANHIIFSMAAYIRAHKEEPLLTQSLVVGVLVFFAVLFGSELSAFAAVLFYTSTITLVSLPWAYSIFRVYYFR